MSNLSAEISRIGNTEKVTPRSASSVPRVAVVIPCFNEEAAIGVVVQQFRSVLPEASIYVYDNNSRDRTIEVATRAGAIVRSERRQGKGHVVRRMFGDVDADVYILVDGDATYHAPSAPAMIELLLSERVDMVVGTRRDNAVDAYRPGHRFGNAMLTGSVTRLFGKSFTDMLSGYRVMSRRFVKSFPCLSDGFEIETELTIHCLSLRLPVAELETPYGARPEGSQSKLSTFRDGWRILKMILALWRSERPFQFFFVLAILLSAAGLGVGVPVVVEYLATGLVPRFPSAILAASLQVLAALALSAGLVLDTVSLGRREMKRLMYLSHSDRANARDEA